MSIQMNKPEEPVVGLPFSADQTVSLVQHLANGMPLKSEIKGHTYRSAAGIERYDGVMPSSPAGSAPVTMAYIVDRAKHTVVLLNFKLKTATSENLPANSTVSVKFLPLQQSRTPGQTVKPADLVTTDLGKRTEGMMTLIGKRVSGTIAAGSAGNDQPLIVKTDVWFDPQLKLKVNEIEQNPFSGERTFELTNIRGEEPDVALFEIPEGFAVKERPSMLGASPPLTPEQREKQIPSALSSTDPSFKNSVAYALANSNSHLADAETLAEDAVRLEEQKNSDVASKGNRDENYKQSVTLCAYWDTLGWVYYREAKQEKAEAYLLAAWNLKPNPEEALHLGSVYEAQHRPKDAAAIYEMALSGQSSPIWQDDFQTRLAKLGDAQAEKVPMEVTTSLPSFTPKLDPGDSEPLVEIIFTAGAPPAVTYLNGEPAYGATLTRAIQSAVAGFLPDGGPETILRRAHVSCAAGQNSNCTLHFLTPGMKQPAISSPTPTLVRQ